MILLAQICTAVGLLALTASVVFALVVRPRPPAAFDDDTVAFVPIGPPDGQLIRVEGRVVVATPVRAPSGRACAIYELYAGDGSAPALALRQRGVRFVVDDGVQAVQIDPSFKLTTYDLPMEVIDGPHAAPQLLIERRLQAGARVEVVGRVWRQGAPGHEELTLVPPAPHVGVEITFLSA